MNAQVIPFEQHDRRRYIGGSDVAAVLGISPWRTPLALWEQKPEPCPCGEATCDEPWEPGCGLGRSEEHVRVAAKPAGEAVDAEALARIAKDMREWGTGEGCFNDDPEGKPLLCVYWAQQPYLKLCDEIEAIARRLSGQEG